MTWQDDYKSIARRVGERSARFWAEWFGHVEYSLPCRQCGVLPKDAAFLSPELCEECWYASPRVVDRRAKQMDLFEGLGS